LFQPFNFTRKYYLQFAGQSMCRVTLIRNRFLIQKLEIDSLVSLCGD